MFPIPRPDCRCRRCFNGAAPARARNVGDQAGFDGTVLAASTGPRPRGRGMKRINRPKTRTHLCFNGAAPARARNAASLSRISSIFSMLQRGRARAGAECFGAGIGMVCAGQASTGPRPRGRGMALVYDRFVTPFVLQRGRARAGAECVQGSANLLPVVLLQRGRARAGAECGFTA